MPLGLAVMHWDDRIGVEVLAGYPPETSIQENTLMQIYSQHEFSGDAGMVTLTAGAVNLASYYTGLESSVYIILILTAEEDGDVYEEGLVESSHTVSISPSAVNSSHSTVYSASVEVQVA